MLIDLKGVIVAAVALEAGDVEMVVSYHAFVEDEIFDCYFAQLVQDHVCPNFFGLSQHVKTH